MYVCMYISNSYNITYKAVMEARLSLYYSHIGPKYTYLVARFCVNVFM